MNEYFAFAVRHWPLVAALGVVLILLIADEVRRRLSRIQEIPPPAAVQLINRGAVVVDCRDLQAFREGHIVGARNLPVSELAKNVESLARKREKPVVVIGASPREAMRAAAILKRGGFSSIMTIKGGLASWSKENLPLERTG